MEPFNLKAVKLFTVWPDSPRQKQDRSGGGLKNLQLPSSDKGTGGLGGQDACQGLLESRIRKAVHWGQGQRLEFGHI